VRIIADFALKCVTGDFNCEFRWSTKSATWPTCATR